jgi:hypothetical protein
MDARAQMLGTLAANLPSELKVIHGQLLNIVELSTGFYNNIVDKANGVNGLKEDVEEQIQKYRDLTQQQHQELVHEIEQLEEQANRVHKVVDEAQAKLVGAFVDIQNQISKELLQQIHDASEAKKTWWEKWRDGYTQFQQKATDSQAQLNEHLESCKNAMGLCGFAAFQNWDKLQHKTQTLSEHVIEIHGQSQQMVHDTHEAYEHLQEAYGAYLEALHQEHIGPAMKSAAEQIHDHVHDSLKPRLEDHSSGLVQAVVSTIEQMEASRHKAAEHRAELEPHIHAVQELIDPLHTALDAAREAVGKVGLTFG